MCPADPLTWKFVQAFIRDLMDTTQADGLYATFWDSYGIDCKDPRCAASGMDKFPNQLYACVKAYHDAVQPLGKKLVIRTWSSGVPHWLGDQYVHAPGYDAFGGSGLELWCRVIKELPADIILQNKVYDSDCQPDARLNPMLGMVQPHPEIAPPGPCGRPTKATATKGESASSPEAACNPAMYCATTSSTASTSTPGANSPGTSTPT
jgi:hypothetical protein